MNEVIVNEDINVENLIYEIRGKQVMIDSDLAKLYKCANGTKTINLAVKRHINRFPERFMFQLTKIEYNNLQFQIETANNMSRSLPYVFTEQGVAMLATIIRTEVAEKVSIRIMDAFVAMRHYIGNNENRLSNVESKVLEHDNEIRILQESFNNLTMDETIVCVDDTLKNDVGEVLLVDNNFYKMPIKLDVNNNSALHDSLPNDGKNYITSLKNQLTTDLCTVFSTTAYAETSLIKNYPDYVTGTLGKNLDNTYNIATWNNNADEMNLAEMQFGMGLRVQPKDEFGNAGLSQNRYTQSGSTWANFGFSESNITNFATTWRSFVEEDDTFRWTNTGSGSSVVGSAINRNTLNN